eukprot:CAMPEP_0183507008 /NCGR_PEP_ID=MMETSP0371-20130417/7899_1 /TAXON_ID=268820 /ORGANISM="Peridinium aciculiferum, Strain PAER-2" /LENGTH=201 /DNA_ID=CAMNT_0025703113 /DNA_START=13 /DNA_END=615 /DNA_ORIENTATION=+
MAKFRAGMVAVVASMVSFSQGQPWMFNLTGACDMEDGIEGMSFVKQGTTRSGAPYYKAMRGEKYLYYDPDCMTPTDDMSTDGTPRWIIDKIKPNVTRDHDLDGDGVCNYIAGIESNYYGHPPTRGEWTMNCAGNYQQHFLVLLEVTTTETLTTTTRTMTVTTTTTTRAPLLNAPKSLTLSGACAFKRALNGLTYDLAGTTA